MPKTKTYGTAQKTHIREGINKIKKWVINDLEYSVIDEDERSMEICEEIIASLDELDSSIEEFELEGEDE